MWTYKNNIFFIFICSVFFNPLWGNVQELVIVGGGIIGGIEAYYAYCDAKREKVPLRITIYEKNKSIFDTTIANIVPSLTIDEILAVVPRGSQLIEKLKIRFNHPAGIRVDNVPGIEGSIVAEQFKQEAYTYSLDQEGHNQRTQDLLALGKMSMDLWIEMYEHGDDKFKQILKASNFNPCYESSTCNDKALHEGYRIDLIYNIPNAQERALNMKQSYEALGYTSCALLTPTEVIRIDPFITDFCNQHSTDNVWHNDAIALWRPGGCIDAQTFLPELYKYLHEEMGTYSNDHGKQEHYFTIELGQKITGIEFAKNNQQETVIAGLQNQEGHTMYRDSATTRYVFCPGQAVGTLKQLGLCEPAYAGFAGVSLKLNIEIPDEKLVHYRTCNHCMEVHQEGVVLAWQVRFKDNKVFIGVAGTKAFYSDQQPTTDQEFARNRNVLQLNMINDVLPEFISLAFGYDTHAKVLTENDLFYLESQGIATRWAGIRAVAYDGFPTLGCVYEYNSKSIVSNARCTTHLGSGGGSFAPGAVTMSRKARDNKMDPFTQRILDYGSSCRIAEAASLRIE